MIRWFAQNGVAANLLGVIAVVAGLFVASTIKLELFPEFELDIVQVQVVYPGAAPEEIETGVIQLIENRIQDIEGISKLTAIAAEGVGTVLAEVRRGFDPSEVAEQMRVRIDGIDNFPVEAERPQTEELSIPSEVISLAIFGPVDERTLKAAAEDVRSRLESAYGFSQINVSGVRNYEVSINVSEIALRRYGLTFDQIAEAVQLGSIDIPGGTIKAEGGEILLRTQAKALSGEAFKRLPVFGTESGIRLLIEDVAEVVDGFTDDILKTEFNGQPAVILSIYAVGDENILDLAEQVEAFAVTMQAQLPEGLEITAFRDFTFYLKGRLAMLIQNGLIGLVLVLAILTVFLRPSLAFFVMLGIPIAFLGSLLLLPTLGVTINLASLFGFILVLGIVVDDAIIVGESVFTEAQARGRASVEASIAGARRVAIPVTFAILTTIVAFIPILTLPGVIGKFFYPIPVVVIVCLIWSLIQAKLVLPYHLTLCRVRRSADEVGLHWFQRQQRKIADGLERFIVRYYQPFLKRALAFRYTTVAAFIALLALSLGIVAGERLRYVFFPPVPSDYIIAQLTMPEGTSATVTTASVDRMVAALDALEAEVVASGLGVPFQNRIVTIGARPFQGAGDPAAIGQPSTSPHIAEIAIELTKSEERVGGGSIVELSAPVLAQRWREKIGAIPGARELIFQANAAEAAGKVIDIELAGPDMNHLQEAAARLREHLGSFPALFDITDSFSEGKQEVKIAVNQRGEALGLTNEAVGRQVRAAFFGIETQRFQRGRDDVRVMLRFPPGEREAIERLEGFRIRLADGSGVPFSEVADYQLDEGFASIRRINRQRTINISADADKDTTDVRTIRRALTMAPAAGAEGVEEGSFLDNLVAEYPGMNWAFAGEFSEQQALNEALIRSTALALFVIYALLAIAFRSYLQPFLVMVVIPFGLIGAIGGHLIMGQPLSVLSILGFVALAGVVVNDSLVLIDHINQERRKGVPIREAIEQSGARRFRPILLTSLTTFAGLLPLLFETSLQAQFLIPMAISLSFGVLFATFITLLLVPAAYFILEDARDALHKLCKLPPNPSSENRSPDP